MGGGLESRCVGRVYSADGAVRLILSSWGLVRFNDQLKHYFMRKMHGQTTLKLPCYVVMTKNRLILTGAIRCDYCVIHATLTG